ncbi:MAG: hypothetical protein U0271_00435 [Polyangiaceae bacterium]
MVVAPPPVCPTSQPLESSACTGLLNCVYPESCPRVGPSTRTFSCSEGVWIASPSCVAAKPPPPLTVTECRANADGDAGLASCHWSVGTAQYCGGAAPPPEMLLTSAACICNGCETDRDCGGGKVCMSVPSNDCLSDAKVCVKAKECKGTNATCATGCLHDGRGQGGCIQRVPPRP